MMRLLGAALVALSGALLGQRAAEGLCRRERALEEMAQGLEGLERELELSAAPLPQLMDRLIPRCRGPAEEMFRGCREALERLEEESLSQAWRRLAEERIELGEEGRRCLAALGDCLGRWDSGEQRRGMAAVRGRLEELAALAREERRRQSGVYRALGLSGGIFLMIMLL